MASKATTTYILNVSSSMKDQENEGFQKALNIVVNSIENKVITKRKTDLVSVLLAGTPETANQLAVSQGGYDHITELCDLCQPDLPLLKALMNTTTTGDPNIKADVLDALIIAIYMTEQKCKQLKYIKHITLLTDSSQEIDWRDFDDVKSMLVSNNIALTVVGVDLNETTKTNENYTQWKSLTESITDGMLYSLDQAMEEVDGFRNKIVRATPVYTGFLYFGYTPYDSTDFCSISCKMYLRTTAYAKALSTNMYSTLSEGPTHTVTKHRKYVLSPEANMGVEEDDDGDEVEVDEVDLEKGFRFGKSVVKVSSDELDYSKFHMQRELTILYFVPLSALPRDYYITKTHVVAAGDVQAEEAGRAIGALAHALFDKKVGAIARWVQKVGQPPKVGVLLPHFEPGVSILHFIQLPFANDIRYLQFDPEPKFNRDPKDEEADRLMDEFIDRMDIGDIEMPDPEDPTKTCTKEYLIPEETFNPSVYMIENAIKKRALNGTAPLPELDPRLRSNIELLPQLEEVSKEYGKKLQAIYNVKEVPKKKRGEYTNRQGEDQPNMDAILQGDQEPHDENHISNILRIDVRKIGMEDPLADFNAMVNNTEEDLVESAVKQLGDLSVELVSTSFGDAHSKKAIRYLQEMRRVAVREDEAETFNNTLYRLKEWYNTHKTLAGFSFWKLLKESNMTLISNEETSDRKVQDVTKEIALKFLEDEPNTNQNPDIMVDDDIDMWDDSDLLDDL